ncbi:glycoside hydrolase family 127 protein [Cohnella sp. WQ 127256]|uniref:glycoside hydrolase family 127 protein n=1 Tax=Cohnella sp. WQ 127256 TaxID=2938790 RepID=UPI0021189C05|nr:beta-L-arabinofuranosidase domain-containing protein [Cohnella sp. WQ 127256]
MIKHMNAVPINNVTIEDSFWAKRQQLVRETVIPYQWEALNDTIPGAEPSHTIENFRIASGELKADYYGMVFQDSDLAKWLEAVGYALSGKRDEKLEAIADGVIDLLERAQQSDGYLNTYFTVAKPGKKWTNLRDDHELYCAGHLIEAAVAYYEATGKRKMVDIMSRYADHMVDVFGKEPGQIRGYDGHPEIELALVRLYRVTGNTLYLELSRFFVEERGQEPYFFDIEESQRTEHRVARRKADYFQAHLPVREQKTAEGHAVRALYLFSGAVDLAVEYNDRELLEVCKELWRNVTRKRMYITGGVGSNENWESFTIDYDLPNDRAYTETCASISLMFLASRLLQIEADREYADVMERVLYNGILSGISLDGKGYFYVNPLEVWPAACDIRDDLRSVARTRQAWFGCACCPPNIARLIASLGQYIYSYNENDREWFVHLYIGGQAHQTIDGHQVQLTQQSNYPWDGNISFTVAMEQEQSAEFTLALRLPGWCKEASLKVNGEAVELTSITSKGYAKLKRVWASGDRIELVLPMTVEKVRSNPKVRENIGKLALQRGPIVFCLEETDNGDNLRDIRVSGSGEFVVHHEDGLLDGIVFLRGNAWRTDKASYDEDSLYSTVPYSSTPVQVKAIPYYAWANREPGEMLVWLHEDRG